jgi:hypothetical protein
MTVGVNRDPFNADRLYVIRAGSFGHGFVIFGEGGKNEVVVSMLDQPVRPVPPGGYAAKFGEPGARSVDRIVLTARDDPQVNITFDALGRSNANRIRALLEDLIVHLDTEAGQLGYIHPVIRVFSGHYFHKEQGREIYHFDYEIVGWMNDPGDLWGARQQMPDGDTPTVTTTTRPGPPLPEEEREGPAAWVPPLYFPQ